MNKKYLLYPFLPCIVSLSGCTLDEGASVYPNELPYHYQEKSTLLYPEGYESATNPPEWQEKKGIAVPESYHVGASRPPVSSKESDQTWIKHQHPQHYTIELADDEKAAIVANTVHNTPKNDHIAEIKYNHQSKTHYKGVYGSFSTLEAAKEAFSALPASVKAGATIKTWDNVQQITPE